METQIICFNSDKKESFSISFAQERMWLLEQVKPGNPAYHIRRAVQITGLLKAEILEQSINEIVRRHEILRTTFNVIDEQPRQIINSPSKFKLPVIDLQKLSATEQEQEAQRLITQIVLSPFNFSIEPLWRVSLLRKSLDLHIMVLSMHNIVCDGDRTTIFFQEVAALYEAFCAGKPSPLKPLPIQYKEFALQERQQLQEEILNTQLTYWKQQLGDNLPILQLPTDRPRPAIQTYSGASQRLKLSASLSKQLKHLSQQEGVTLFATLLAAFKTLLYRYTREEDIIVGSPVSSRLPNTEELIGYFANPLVLRTDMSGNPSFRQLLSRVSEVISQAYNHQDYPFQKLVEELQPRDLALSPFFQVLFIFNSVMPTLELPSLTMTPLDVEGKTVPFDLCISIKDTDSKLVFSWEYNTDLFESATIARILKHFQNLLESIVASPEGRIGELPLLTEVERHQLLVEWNNTKTEYARTCIHKLVEAQVEKTPEAVAVIWENQRLTYRELNCRANQLAHHLQKLGVKPEELVGIYQERSPQMMVAILAILKAGGAYLPLDPAYPKERLEYMLSDANVQVLLTTKTLLNASSQIALDTKNQEIVYLDDWEKISLESDANPVSIVKPHNLAYVIYTSGSTGKPKGVMMEHQALANLIDWHLQNRTKGALLQFASLSFDISFHEIFSTWCSSQTLVLIKEEVRHDPEALLNAIAQNQISKLYLPFVALQQLAVIDRIPTTLREVMTAGEQLHITPTIANFFRQTGCTLHNHYGATECQDVTTFTLTGDANSWQILPPIGRPINNIQTYILDEFYQPVPVGVLGELYIGGEGLARGYFNRPDLTQEKFIPNPFGRSGGAQEQVRQRCGRVSRSRRLRTRRGSRGESSNFERLYKTGDLARYLPDGNIEHLGRADRQVKIRGFRIELGEIEGLLAKHPTVLKNAVVLREDVPGIKRLIAYVVPVQGQVAPQLELALRSYLREHLPDYMMPAAIVMLDQMPLTPSGKIDRRALPQPDLSRPLAGALVMPQSETEKLIASVWQEVLQLEVGIYDNFFELGGNSLLVIQVHKKLIQIFGAGLPIVTLFQHPTVHALAQYLQKPTVKLLRQGNISASDTELPLVRVSQILKPLSFAQERIWFLSQLEQNNPFYNELEALRLLGSLNVVALQQSLNKIIQRHEALRTNFTTVDEQPVQVIADSLTLTVPVVDLGELPESDREIACQQLATSQAQRPFDLVSDPLIQATLVKLTQVEHVLLLKIHHIVWDGWSMDVFVQELAAFYSAGNDLSLELPELPIQYTDFAVWQRQWLQGEVLSSHLAYWKQQLEGAPALLELPTDRVRTATQTFRGARQTVALGFELTEALKSLSQRQSVTLFMTLLAAFQVLLSRYTGQTDICVGTAHANRDRPEINTLIGFFVNTLVLRTDLSGNPSFTQLLAKVRDVALGAYTHKDVPFEKLVEELQPERDLSYTPLVQVMLVLNEPIPQVHMAGLTVSSLAIETATAKFDLILSLQNTNQGIIGQWEYNTHLFDADTIKRMAGHFQTLLEAIVADPNQPMRELPLLTDVERHQLLVEWNDTQTPYPPKCIHQLFEEQVERTPNAVAVVFDKQQITYEELNTKANQLAHHLQSLGVAPEVLVGLCVERSIEMVVGLLGILKAGGAYVPLDPAYPSERLAFMLSDAALSVLLTQQRLVERIPNHYAKVVCLDGEWENSADGGANPSNHVIENLAYVIYTSGTTGQPKGVMVQHRGLLNLVFWHQQAFGVLPSDRATQIAGVGFDACGWEIWPYLTAGASIYFPDSETYLDPERLVKWLGAKAITISFLPTPLLEKVLQLNWQQEVALRILLTGGDQLHHYPNASHPFALVNNYGPTENTVVTTSGRVPFEERSLLPTIGRPIANTQAYVLDAQLQPLPIGVPGELYISGDGLARGYLNRPELTAEKFIPNPFYNSKFKIQNSKLYKTGDKARYLVNGTIEYLERLDNQVKIRGFRIELGEIEATLGTHPGVQQTLVMVREDIPGDKRIVAYVVVKPEQSLVASELRSFLLDRLPEYMVPAAFVFIDAMPLTPNGKIDRRAMPVPKTVGPVKQIAPRTPIEEAIANIWAEVLIEQVGVDDNFFTLGGHSLLATQIISRIRTSLAVEIPLRDLFKNPTVSTLAQCVETALQSGSSLLLPLLPVRREQAIPLSFAQQRLWFLAQLEPGNAVYNIPVAVRLYGELNVAGLQQSLNCIISRHEVLRTNFAIQDGKPVQVIALSLTLSLATVDLQALVETEREMTCQEMLKLEALQGFDLSNEPLIRAKLFHLKQNEYVLSLVMHHIIFDGWSMSIFVRELAALYEGFCTNKSTVLPQLPIQYADFAYWQQQWFQQGGYESQLAYWKQQLEGATFVLELPTDYPRKAHQTSRGAKQSIVLSRQLSDSLVTLSQFEGVTLFMTLLAAFQILLWRYSGQDDICVGTPIANRNLTEIEGLIGFFVNTLVLRTHLEGDPSFRQLLLHVREVALGAYTHQDLPFEHLVEQLQPERDVSRHPIFQVWFNLLKFDRDRIELADLTIETLPDLTVSSKFDLSVTVGELKEGLLLELTYNSYLFEDATIASMLRHWQNLLADIVKSSDRPISSLSLLSETEIKDLLGTFNDNLEEEF
ncbi:amino acid adenylation domain-containing protein [Iningainema tapete]|uniref:Amino acid adenylation domain-containing protein n=1 Tax=Iningainema tapete BLCC-T55 TaxID=2748662 RepID=A0A8J7BY77_9CYAN|nr:non-ribosomal peptide synthetase [Iningainema tapete]MBD2773823.1 amino acid adenylation domain-containing protein [Iningainema tapete BLCC-T55]